MPVVTEGKTLVGTITRSRTTTPGSRSSRTSTAPSAPLILESRAQGVVSGGYNRHLAMEFVGQDSAVKEGDTVVTPGLGGTYPAGLVIGKVTGVSGNRQEIFRSVTVEPLASLARLETVLVMTSFVPMQADGAMSYYLALPLAPARCAVEASVLPMFRIGGLQPNLCSSCSSPG